MEHQFPAYMMPQASQPQPNDMFVFATTNLPQAPLHLNGYDDFINFSYPPPPPNPDTMDGGSSGAMFSPMSRMNMHGSNPQILSQGLGGADIYKQQQHQQQHQQHHPHEHQYQHHDRPREISLGPHQPPTPPLTTPPSAQSLPSSSPAIPSRTSPDRFAREALTEKPGNSDDVLADMVHLLAQPDAWNAIPNVIGDATLALSHDARDRIVATVQLLLHRALQSRSPPSQCSQGLFGRIVALPPSHVLVHFIDMYAARIDSVQPYLGLAGCSTTNIHDILSVDMADIGMLLIILLITQGAMLTDQHESHVLAHGLIEVCRIALDDLLESQSIAQPMVGGSALQLLTLCTRSGKDCLTSYALSKRGQYLSMLKNTGLLQPEQSPLHYNPDGLDLWERWKEQEQRNRHAYAWVYVDLELSLLHDLPPILSINDLQVPLPHENHLWNAPSYNNWFEASGTQGTHETPSLNAFFRSFLQGRLAGSEDLPVHHLRLLLHPLQAMVLEQQQLLRIFDTDEPSNRYRVLSKIKILGRLQETQDMLQDLATLLNRHSMATPTSERGGTGDWLQSAKWVSMIMLHLVSLNVFTSIPEIEKCAREEPPASDAARAEMWRRARYPEGESYVLFHAGQIFRLIDSLPLEARPTWWPVAFYRASMACWALRSLDRQSPGLQQIEVNIDAILPSEEERSHNTTLGIPVVTLPDGRRLAVLEGSNSLRYCISKLESYPSHLVRGIIDKVRFFSDRWSY
ncbi:Transcription factor Cmr1 [Pyrenophora tritici-repentis]|uniref:Transcription factor Cmr1 n=2 Tax=Pyrenophora tritici-repentis TaxID=45151 RepID=A0A922N1J1_9PLEO|nr:transcription factor Cmr1 [Pyrenophora tritici-repentis Pt-1C-BFP]EDU48785.1 transcription factor Cmr1 [Pyrenophora tritici-repentis Pt-1C-BFP]KAI1507621.1 Transcription factor Cmr1 [Pyrenophora tritici-repentis]KAI1667094.1 Transcription factor Cmr1 [Pyrenophora tritici-repentis]KAI1682946.1 Transcription factor Cmr1 [Pyrenophora tritici-repentis]